MEQQDAPNGIAVKAAVDAASAAARMGADISYLVKSVDNLSLKMDNLPNSYASVKIVNDLQQNINAMQQQIDSVQRYMWMGIGGLGVLTFALKFFVR